ncbi:STAS domain-containing protein [Actinotalea sp. Marseille-Q4924]|uniref:STAS domain-containing protein n=1 Tax=Actinotalea sp. Marseille-Q4924 TaxID=2866571 RepID=UPI00351D0C40
MQEGSGQSPDERVDAPELVDSTRPGPVAESQPGSVQVIVQGGRTRIVLSGEIDADLGPDLQEATTDAESTGLPIDIDTEHVTFMDSSGIAFLARIATRTGSRTRVIRPPETVRFLLEVTRIGELLEVVTDATPDDDGPDHGLPTIGPAGRGGRLAPTPDDVA